MENDPSAIERLYEDESLTADLDDDPARVLLNWAERQLQQGQTEEKVRQTMRALVRVVAGHERMPPEEARARLEQAGIAAADSALASLWAEKLPDGEWAGRLLQSLTPSPSPTVPARSPQPPHERGGEVGEGEEKKPNWWRRLFSRREAR